MRDANVAVIPAKATSSRVPNKNFREFFKGRSLLEIKIEQCLRSGVFDEVYVSGNSEIAREQAEKCGAIYLPRSDDLCADDCPWSSVLCGVLDTIPVALSSYIAWCPLTSPLFAGMAEVVKSIALEEEYDSVMTVSEHKHFFLSPDMLPLNFQFGVWASYSQALRPLYQMNCAMWYAKKEAMLRNRFQLGDRPKFFQTTFVEGLDIDNMEEFELAKLIYEARHA